MALRKIVSLFFVLFLAGFMSGQSQTPSSTTEKDLSSISDTDLRGLVISMERNGCFGTCPVYSLTIHGDGSVRYSGEKYVKVAETRETTISLQELRTLLKEFEKAKFVSIGEDFSGSKCTCGQCTDMASAVLQVKVGSISHKVNHYFGCACAPKSLFELELAIDKAVDSQQWVGDLKGKGPFGTTCFGARPN